MTVLYEEENLVVLSKPTGIDTYSYVRSVGNELRRQFVSEASNLLGNTSAPDTQTSLAAVHRLDYGTSGCLLAGFTSDIRNILSQHFRNNLIAKRYRAIVQGDVSQDRGVIDEPLLIEKRPTLNGHTYPYVKTDPAGKASFTHFSVVERFGRYTLLELSPHTGRTHQLRVHCAHMGHSIVGDDRYGLAIRGHGENLCLHAAHVSFPGISGKTVTVEAPLPPHMCAMLNAIKVRDMRPTLLS